MRASSFVICLTDLANLSPNFMYYLRFGTNRDAVQREANEADVHGLKIAQMLLPVTKHRIDRLAAFKEHYNKTNPLFTPDENEAATLGAGSAERSSTSRSDREPCRALLVHLDGRLQSPLPPGLP
jgi:hypothetical protein